MYTTKDYRVIQQYLTEKYFVTEPGRFDRSSGNSWGHTNASNKVFNSGGSSGPSKPWAKDSWRPNNNDSTGGPDRQVLVKINKVYYQSQLHCQKQIKLDKRMTIINFGIIAKTHWQLL